MNFFKDSYYIDKVLNGDTSAFSFLVEKHKDLAFTIAFKITKNREDAEEIAQDAFLKAFQSLKKFKKKSKFSTWLYKIVYNTAVSKTRKKKIEFSPIDEELIENYSLENISYKLDLINEETQKKHIDKAISKLPEDENIIVNLFYMNENSIKEISKITGLSVSNVKIKLYRIRKKLYIELEKLFNKELIKIT